MFNTHRSRCFRFAAFAALLLLPLTAVADGTLRIYLLAGQSNSQGHAYTYINNGGSTWNIPTLEYQDNLVDLAKSIRDADDRIPDDLGIVIGESSDQNAALNTARIAAVAELNGEIPGSAAYFDTDNMIGQNWGNNPDGAPFSSSWGYHFNAKAENYLEIGWRMGGAILDNGYDGSLVVTPEPGTLTLLGLGGLLIALRRRRRA